MDVLATGTFAPEDIVWLVRFIELHDANRAVAFDRLARAARFSDFSLCGIGGECGDWCVCEDLRELGGKEGKLVREIFSGFQDVDEDLSSH